MIIIGLDTHPYHWGHKQKHRWEGFVDYPTWSQVPATGTGSRASETPRKTIEMEQKWFYKIDEFPIFFGVTKRSTEWCSQIAGVLLFMLSPNWSFRMRPIRSLPLLLQVCRASWQGAPGWYPSGCFLEVWVLNGRIDLAKVNQLFDLLPSTYLSLGGSGIPVNPHKSP